MSIDLGGVLSAATEYGDARAAEVAAEANARLEEVRAECAATVARIQADHARVQAEYDAHMATHAPPPPPRTTVIGMSAPANKWDERLAQVGADGIKARRIFGDFTTNGRSQSTLIEAAIAAGQTPIVSYKGTPSAANIKAVRDYLASLDAEVYATWHHEPNGDMTPAEFRDGSKAFLAAKSAKVKVGPILNGWLLDNKRAEFMAWTSPELFTAWDFLGIDTYQKDAASPLFPGHRIPPLLEVLTAAGRPDMPVIVGEYNGWTAEAIAESGRIFLDCPNVVIACMWNSGPTGLGIPLEGARLDAFRATVRDPRVKR